MFFCKRYGDLRMAPMAAWITTFTNGVWHVWFAPSHFSNAIRWITVVYQWYMKQQKSSLSRFSKPFSTIFQCHWAPLHSIHPSIFQAPQVLRVRSQGLLDLHGRHVGIRRTGDHQGSRGGHQPDPKVGCSSGSWGKKKGVAEEILLNG